MQQQRRGSTGVGLDEGDDNIDPENVNQAFARAYNKSTTMNQDMLRKEFNIAYAVLRDTGKPPIIMDQNCLSCMAPGRDTSMTLKLFRTACLSY